MRSYTCAECNTPFKRSSPSTGLNAFCNATCRKRFYSRGSIGGSPQGLSDNAELRLMLRRANDLYLAALQKSGKHFEDADVPAEERLAVMKPETIVAGYGTTAAWSAVPGSASGRDDKQMREFPADISVAPLRSLGAA